MKRYNLLIEDKNEKEWDYFVKNKEEGNLEEAILNLIKDKNLNLKKNKMKRREEWKTKLKENQEDN